MNKFKKKLLISNGDWGLGIGDWGLEIEDWGVGPIRNRNTTKHNAQTPEVNNKNSQKTK